MDDQFKRAGGAGDQNLTAPETPYISPAEAQALRGNGQFQDLKELARKTVPEASNAGQFSSMALAIKLNFQIDAIEKLAHLADGGEVRIRRHDNQIEPYDGTHYDGVILDHEGRDVVVELSADLLNKDSLREVSQHFMRALDDDLSLTDIETIIEDDDNPSPQEQAPDPQ